MFGMQVSTQDAQDALAMLAGCLSVFFHDGPDLSVTVEAVGLPPPTFRRKFHPKHPHKGLLRRLKATASMPVNRQGIVVPIPKYK